MRTPSVPGGRSPWPPSSATWLDHLRQRGFVALGQFLHALGQRLADAVHLAVDGGIERGKPFVVHHQRLDLGLGELGVLGVGLGIERGLGVLEPAS